MLKRLALGAAAALALLVPAGAAFAHDDGGSFDDYWQHAQDHEEHGDFHGQEAYAHARAHAEGFYNPEEHAAWHENAQRAHEAFHQDHPDTWHDHYDGGGGGYYGSPYGRSYSYGSYYHHNHRHRGYSNGSYQSYQPNLSVYWGY